MSQKFILNKKWRFRPAPGSALPNDIFIPPQGMKATVPGTVHTDLLNNGLIADPFFSDNEKNLQWVDTIDWIYEIGFDRPTEFTDDAPLLLVFDGVDTIGDVYLNGRQIGCTRNMFRKYTFDISNVLLNRKNKLQLYFKAAGRYAYTRRTNIKQLPSARYTDRVFIRKAQYSFGWDWGPSFLTTGIWRPVYLLQNERVTLETVSFNTDALKENKAKIRISVSLKGRINRSDSLQLKLSNDNQVIEKRKPLSKIKNHIFLFEVQNPDLWWPNGSGTANLYRLEIKITDRRGKDLDRRVMRVGIRTITLQTVEEKGETFRFLINNQPLFVKGANWIPADSFLPRVKDTTYKHLLSLARQAHMNMIRVWGGGTYEDDFFYQFCDEMGLLVWQDFMFACATYPESRQFLTEVEKEIRENVTRLQYHPCISIWCGNNENEWIWYRDHCGPQENMPGYTIYHKRIPAILKKLDPLRPYWPTTPFGKEKDPNDPSTGNRHVWDIWSRWMDYREVVDDTSLFVTEFGFQAPANYQTLKKVLPAKALKPHSRLFEFHNKQEEGPERITRFLAAHLPVQMQIEDYIYLSQLNQGFALQTCLEHWRLRRPESNGSIIWQLNDCWPVSSWSLIDSDGLPKPAYYFVKRTFSPQLCAFRKKDENIDLLACNQSTESFNGCVDIYEISSVNGRIRSKDTVDIFMKPNQIEKIAELDFPTRLKNGQTILISDLLSPAKNSIHRNFFQPLPWKYMTLYQSKVDLNYGNNEAEVSANICTFFATLQSDRTIFSDNALILLPGEKKRISIQTGPTGTENPKRIRIRTLNQYLTG